MPNNLYDHIDYVLINEEQLQKRIQEIADDITAKHADHENILLICVLKGAIIFLADLTRALKRPHELEFMAISSYEGKGTVPGAVRLVMDLKQDISNKHVIVVEDIVDSGNTIKYMRGLLEARMPASIEVCSLLTKPSRREVEVDIDYVGFEVPDEFVVGYGLDFDELYRNLSFIGVLKPEFIPSH